MERNDCLNLLKCISCFGVVFIHITFPGIMGDIFKYLSNFAVPIFFMIAGYYSYRCNENKIKKRFLKILKIFIFSYSCFLTYNLIFAIKDGNVSGWLVDNFNLKSPVYFFIFCTIPWAIPLWYLIAMAEVYFFWNIVVKNKKEEKMIKCTWFLLILGAIWTIIVDSIGLNWSYKINFIFRALPWFMLGYLVKVKYENYLDKISNKILLFINFLGCIITLSVVFMNPIIKYYYFGVVVTAPSLFLIGIKNSKIHVNKFVVYIGDKLSLFIYIFHVIISRFIYIIVKFMKINTEGLYAYFHPIVTLCVTIIFSVMLEYIFRNDKLRKLIY